MKKLFVSVALLASAMPQAAHAQSFQNALSTISNVVKVGSGVAKTLNNLNSLNSSMQAPYQAPTPMQTMPPPTSYVTKMRNGLPATSMDSFVNQAGEMADMIYGDEGTTDIPPYFEFTPDHRIQAGIFGMRNAGLTTGHASYLPDAWGADEFLIPGGGPTSGASSGWGNLNINLGGINIGLTGSGTSTGGIPISSLLGGGASSGTGDGGGYGGDPSSDGSYPTDSGTPDSGSSSSMDPGQGAATDNYPTSSAPTDNGYQSQAPSNSNDPPVLPVSTNQNPDGYTYTTTFSDGTSQVTYSNGTPVGDGYTGQTPPPTSTITNNGNGTYTTNWSDGTSSTTYADGSPVSGSGF